MLFTGDRHFYRIGGGTDPDLLRVPNRRTCPASVTGIRMPWRTASPISRVTKTWLLDDYFQILDAFLDCI